MAVAAPDRDEERSPFVHAVRPLERAPEEQEEDKAEPARILRLHGSAGNAAVAGLLGAGGPPLDRMLSRGLWDSAVGAARGAATAVREGGEEAREAVEGKADDALQGATGVSAVGERAKEQSKERLRELIRQLARERAQAGGKRATEETGREASRRPDESLDPGTLQIVVSIILVVLAIVLAGLTFGAGATALVAVAVAIAIALAAAYTARGSLALPTMTRIVAEGIVAAVAGSGVVPRIGMAAEQTETEAEELQSLAREAVEEGVRQAGKESGEARDDAQLFLQEVELEKQRKLAALLSAIIQGAHEAQMQVVRNIRS